MSRDPDKTPKRSLRVSAHLAQALHLLSDSRDVAIAYVVLVPGRTPMQGIHCPGESLLELGDAVHVLSMDVQARCLTDLEDVSEVQDG